MEGDLNKKCNFNKPLLDPDQIYPGYVAALQGGTSAFPDMDLLEFIDVGRTRVSLKGCALRLTDGDSPERELPVVLSGDYEVVARRLKDDWYGGMLFLTRPGADLFGGLYLGVVETAERRTVLTAGPGDFGIDGPAHARHEILHTAADSLAFQFGTDYGFWVARLYDANLQPCGWWFGAEPLGRYWEDRVLPSDNVLTAGEIVDQLEEFADYPDFRMRPVAITDGEEVLGYVSDVGWNNGRLFVSLSPPEPRDDEAPLTVPTYFKFAGQSHEQIMDGISFLDEYGILGALGEDNEQGEPPGPESEP